MCTPLASMDMEMPDGEGMAVIMTEEEIMTVDITVGMTGKSSITTIIMVMTDVMERVTAGTESLTTDNTGQPGTNFKGAALDRARLSWRHGSMLLDNHHEFFKIFRKVHSETIQHATANPVGNLASLILFTLGGTGLVL